MTSPGDRPIRLRDGSLEWRLVGSEVVFLDVERAEFLALNPSGAALWGHLVDGTSRDQLAAALTERYGLDSGRATADVERLLADLAERRLLET